MNNNKTTFISGGFNPPDISDEDIAEVVSVLKSGWITTGPKTKEFEKEIASYCGTSKSVCLNSNTACSEMTLRLLGVGPGDEVIVPAYTYTATASVVTHVGAKIVMVDSDSDSIEMDYNKMKDAITDKTKVIIPVDLGGVPCDYDRIYKTIRSVDKNHIIIFESCWVAGDLPSPDKYGWENIMYEFHHYIQQRHHN